MQKAKMVEKQNKNTITKLQQNEQLQQQKIGLLEKNFSMQE